ncbi:hypothetical protein EYF80_043355 [Liparis tanakae]|uniref:Uncharacterized protein n=1 Tax=Liparis tanakae TaxID=230148 RepID=A0A4Z2FYW3_9TELE|nr:hypothetical protein EYF80_043355 [Liparis tanakae]
MSAGGTSHGADRTGSIVTRSALSLSRTLNETLRRVMTSAPRHHQQLTEPQAAVAGGDGRRREDGV